MWRIIDNIWPKFLGPSPKLHIDAKLVFVYFAFCLREVTDRFIHEESLIWVFNNCRHYGDSFLSRKRCGWKLLWMSWCRQSGFLSNRTRTTHFASSQPVSRRFFLAHENTQKLCDSHSSWTYLTHLLQGFLWLINYCLGEKKDEWQSMTRRVECDHEAVLESITFILGVTAKIIFSAHLESAKKVE